jgi:hypothetical protein
MLNPMSLTAACRRPWVQVVAFGLILGVTAWLYCQGLGGRWLFDDEPSLDGLAKVTNVDSALDYVFSGNTGPSGRPLALASFLVNGGDWPDNPSGFRSVNVGLHLVNAALFAWLMFLLSRPHLGSRALPVALTAALLWAAHPLLASSVLSVVQRMTLLAATCVLLGLIGYAWGRSKLAERPLAGLMVMSAALVFFTLLGCLAKESAALLPLLAAVVEFSVTAKQANRLSRRVWLAWRVTFFLLPLLMLMAYTASFWAGFQQTYLSRSFGLSERIASEASILWDYARQMLLPRPRELGLFHDDVVARSVSDAGAWIAGTAWLILVLAAIALRRRFPWLLFAVGGFLVGHLLESTVFPLELYFEHRNYVPALFVFGGAAVLIWHAPIRAAAMISVAFLLIYGGTLFNVTTLWGNSTLSARMWFDAHPKSSRAVQFLAQQDFIEGDLGAAAALFTEASERLPKASDLMLQRLFYACGQMSPSDLAALGEATLARFAMADSSFAVLEVLPKLEDKIGEGACPGLLPDFTVAVAKSLVDNPHFRASKYALDHLNNFLARRASEAGNHRLAENYQRAAYQANPNAENAELIAMRLLQQHRLQKAIDFLRGEMDGHADGLRIGPDSWTNKIGDMVSKLEAAQASERHP